MSSYTKNLGMLREEENCKETQWIICLHHHREKNGADASIWASDSGGKKSDELIL